MGYREIFDRQRERHSQVRARSARERARLLHAFADAVEARQDEICAAIQADFRKPPAESDATEILVALLEIRHAARKVGGWMRTRRLPTPLHLLGTRSEIRREPKGNVLIIGPWNYPFQLTVAPLAAAVAAGNCVILKPSELTPATSAVIAELVRQVFDPEEVTVVQGDAAVAGELLELPFDHVFFTGSTRVGKIVMEAAAKHLASVSLELGGKSPAIVDETASLPAAAERLAWGKLVNAGQTCIAPDYALVHESRLEGFLAEFRKAVERFYGPGPDAWKKSPDFARVINGRSFDRLKALVDQTVAAGAKVVMGGEFDAAERFIAPTVVTGVRPSHALMSEELFGPILPVLTYRSLEGEVLPMIRKGDRPLALYVFSKDPSKIRDVLEQTMSGGVCVNNTLIHIVSPHLPFGGVGASGLGSYHGEFGFRAFSHERAVLHQRGWNLARLFFPPYTGRVRWLVRLLAR